MLLALKDWHAFLEVAALKSISKASERLHISQPALSTKLKRLEEDLGFALFERSWEGVRLSAEGSYFLPYALQMLQSIEDASIVLSPSTAERLRTFSEVVNDSCTLRIGIEPWLMPVIMPRLTSVLRAQVQGQPVRLVSYPSLVLKALLRYQCLDMGYFYTVNPAEQSDFEHTHLFEDGAVVIFNHPDGVTTLDAFVHSPEFKQLPFVLFDNPTLNHHRDITKAITEIFNIEKFHVVNDIYLCMKLIEAGLAWTVMTESGAQSLRELTQVASRIRTEPLGSRLPYVKVTLGLATHADPLATNVYQACKQA